MRSTYMCQCGEDIDSHEMRGAYLMCPDNIHEFTPAVYCGWCGERTRDGQELAEVVLLADPTGGSRVVHEPCYDRATMVLA